MRNAKFLLTAVMLVLASTVMAERGMVLLMKDNTKHSFAFVETPVVKADKEFTLLNQVNDDEPGRPTHIL